MELTQADQAMLSVAPIVLHVLHFRFALLTRNGPALCYAALSIQAISISNSAAVTLIICFDRLRNSSMTLTYMTLMMVLKARCKPSLSHILFDAHFPGHELLHRLTDTMPENNKQFSENKLVAVKSEVGAGASS